MYHDYDVKAADIYDNTPKWMRFVYAIMHGWGYRRFLEIEICIATHSLQRKLNKLYYQGILVDSDKKT